MAFLSRNFLLYRANITLVTMLVTLHFAIWLDFGSIISRSFMLSHLGLFLLWQPVWQVDEKLSLENLLLFLIFTLSFTFWLNQWLIFFWLIILTGFIAGRIALDRNQRITYILATIFLVIQLLFGCLPNFTNFELEQANLFTSFLPLLALLIIFFPSSEKHKNLYNVDFIHSITGSLLACLVALGTLLTMFLGESTYFIALAQTSLVLGGFILFSSWLMTSRSELTGITQLWSSYMLNIGTPFEKWLNELSKINDKDVTPDEFLKEAMQALNRFGWISSVCLSIKDQEYELGEKTEHYVFSENNYFNVYVYLYNKPGAALSLHCNLLVQLLENFYSNKVRERELTKQAHLKAIYETGSRITHDIKNLLQSFQAITSIMETESENQAERRTMQKVLKKQLPNLTNRLQIALDKLQTPNKLDQEEIYLKDWWRELQRSREQFGIQYQAEIEEDPKIPVDLFDSVLANLMENAQNKMMHGTNVRVMVSLVANNDSINLTVCDSGESIPAELASELLINPIKSDNGLGVGLYQASEHAKLFGYRLQLLFNQPGKVCFELSSVA